MTPNQEPCTLVAVGRRVPATRRRMLSTGRIAAALGCSREYVSRLIAAGRIAAERTTGGQYRVTRYELERVLDRGLRAACTP